MMRSLMRFAAIFALLWPVSALAQGTIPLAQAQQVDINGKPLAGCLLYTYQAGTISTPQNTYQDFGLTLPNPNNPLQCDQTGRVPMFWLANGLIHARLTTAQGAVVVDTTMQVLGPSSGSGGGGSTVDPTSILSTGDIKFRATAEVLTGWVRMNGLTIGSAVSGATERSNADTQTLFIYLWTNCASVTTNARCSVSGGLGANALADFNANKTITLPDWRDRGPVGRDCMGNSCANVLLPSNLNSGGGDTVDSGGAFGGAPNTPLSQANLPNVNFTVTGTAAAQTITTRFTAANIAGGTVGVPTQSGSSFATNFDTAASSSVTGTAASGGSATPFPNISSFELGTWFVKL